MTIIFIRTVIIYVVLLSAMRLMGKRQIGQLDLSDLITTLLISEIASLPITDADIPISHALIPITVLLTFEVVSSALLVRFPSLKKIISTRPTTLIKDGKLSYSKMKKARISADELIGELRQNNIADISEVQYAILEQSGRISVIQKPEFRPPSAKELEFNVKSEGIYHVIIENGSFAEHGMTCLSLTKDDVYNILKKKHIERRKVYLLLISDSGDVKIIEKDRS